MRTLIIGGGIIGLSIGWQLAREGCEVHLFERALVGGEASWTGAGMLCPISESHVKDQELFELGNQSLHLYSRFLQELEEDSKRQIQFDSHGTLVVGLDPDDKATIEHHYKNKPVEWISPCKARAIEPLLSPRVTCALWVEQEAQIDNRLLLRNLVAAFENRGGKIHEHQPVRDLWIEKGELWGIETTGEKIQGDRVINAAGAWASQIRKNPVRPNKGQILTLQMEPGLELVHVVRSPRIYFAPKRGGVLRVGATSEETGFDRRRSAGAVLQMLEAAFEIIPSIESMEWLEVSAALRPTCNGRLPLIREGEPPGYFEAVGHERSGILLAPYTSYFMKEKIIGSDLCAFA